jgi:hypothetical protein
MTVHICSRGPALTSRSLAPGATVPAGLIATIAIWRGA